MKERSGEVEGERELVGEGNRGREIGRGGRPFGYCSQEGGHQIGFVVGCARGDRQIVSKILRKERNKNNLKNEKGEEREEEKWGFEKNEKGSKIIIARKKRKNHRLKRMKIVFQEKQFLFQQGFSSPK